MLTDHDPNPPSGLVEVGDSVDTTPHVSFYLTVLAALANPNSLVSLFPDTGGEEGGGTPPVALKSGALPEATRAVFRYLGEPEAAALFLGRCVDPLTDPTSQLVPLDPLVALFMAEYQKRVGRDVWRRCGGAWVDEGYGKCWERRIGRGLGCTRDVSVEFRAQLCDIVGAMHLGWVGREEYWLPTSPTTSPAQPINLEVCILSSEDPNNTLSPIS